MPLDCFAQHLEGQRVATRSDRFSRMFDLPSFAEPTPQIQAALMELGAPGGLMDAKDPLHEGPIRLITNPELSPNNRDNTAATAGVTFLGQFLDHDMTFDTTSRLGEPTRPERSPNTRTPAFDLDSVYGGGFVRPRSSTILRTAPSSKWSTVGCSKTCRAAPTEERSSPTRATTRT